MGAHRYTNDIINKSRTFLITDYIQSLIHQYASTTFFIIHHPSSPFIIIIHSSFIFTSSLPSSFDLYSLLLFFRASLSSSSLLSRQGNQNKGLRNVAFCRDRACRTHKRMVNFVCPAPTICRDCACRTQNADFHAFSVSGTALLKDRARRTHERVAKCDIGGSVHEWVERENN